jgi:hypothetical protein
MKFDSEDDRVLTMANLVRDSIAESLRGNKAKNAITAAWAAAKTAEHLETGRSIAEGATVNFDQPLSILQRTAERAAEIAREKGNKVN